MAESFDEIRVHCLAQSRVNPDAVKEWLADLGADEFALDYENGVYDNITDPAMLVALAAKQCYMAFQPSLNPNLTKVRKDMIEYLDNVLKQKHGSVMEHAVYTFGVNGCSRVFTGEMNRHRAGWAISERSMRYVRYENIQFWMPPCFREAEGDSEDLRFKKLYSRDTLQQEFTSQERAMENLAHIWKDELAGTNFHVKKVLTSAFRRVIGMGIATGGVWTGNLRALRHVISLRTDPSAEEEAVHVLMKIGRHMIKDCVELFGDFSEDNGALVPLYWKV